MDLLTIPELMDLDIKNTYQTTVPETVSSNKFGLKPHLFTKYRDHLIKEKRDMELGIFRENKKQQAINDICDLVVKYEA